MNLKKILKKSSWTDILLALVFIIFGILLICFPEFVGSAIAIILGGIFVFFGALKTIDYFSTGKTDKPLLAVSIVAVITGLVIMCCASTVASIFRILISIWIIYNGIMDLYTTIIWREEKNLIWFLTLILSILIIIAGISMFATEGLILQTMGTIILIYGILEIISNIIFLKKVKNLED